VADLVHLSQASGPEPQLGVHFATKNYVDTTGNAMAINARTAAYTLVFGDAGKIVEVNSASALQVTVPLNSTVAFPFGTLIRIRKTGTGNVTVAGASGVTINWASAFVISTQWTMAEIHKRGTDLWTGVLLGA
jgi:hypothetical protein